MPAAAPCRPGVAAPAPGSLGARPASSTGSRLRCLAGAAPATLVVVALSRRYATPARRARGRRPRARVVARAGKAPYEVVPNEGCAFGGSVRGFDLRTIIEDEEAVEQLREDLTKHRLLVFHGQHDLQPDDQIALSEQLGEPNHGVFRAHPKTPDSRMLRLSLDKKQGFPPGESDWHVGGSMLESPFSIQLMHYINAVPGPAGATAFLGLNELLSELDPEKVEQLKRMWFVSGCGDDLLGGDGQVNILPLVYEHPLTGDETMLFHLIRGYCLGFVEEQASMGGLMDGIAVFLDKETDGAPYRRALRKVLGTGKDPPAWFKIVAPDPVQADIRQAIDSLQGEARKRAVWIQNWEDGDFALVDNMALANLPRTPPLIGGRKKLLLHRTATVELPRLRLKNYRGAKTVRLKGDGKSIKDALTEKDVYRWILSGMLRVAPFDTKFIGVESRATAVVSAKREAANELKKGDFSLGLLDQIAVEVQEAKEKGEKAYTSKLKKLFVQLHPDKNPDQPEIVPIFKYLRRLRTEQQTLLRGKMKESAKKSILSKLRKKQAKVSAE